LLNFVILAELTANGGIDGILKIGNLILVQVGYSGLSFSGISEDTSAKQSWMTGS
jgi:hypothetical protein